VSGDLNGDTVTSCRKTKSFGNIAITKSWIIVFVIVGKVVYSGVHSKFYKLMENK